MIHMMSVSCNTKGHFTTLKTEITRPLSEGPWIFDFRCSPEQCQTSAEGHLIL